MGNKGSPRGAFAQSGALQFVFLTLIVSAAFAATATAADEGHFFGSWPALSAAVEHETQKNLDLGESDFLLEIWFKPMPLYSEQHASAAFSLISKKGPLDYQGYKLCYYNNKTVEISLCDRARNLDADLRLSAAGIAEQAGWHYVAASRSNAAKSVRLYSDGKLVAEMKDVQLGSLDNSELFSIAYNPFEIDSQAVCRVREARVWKFPNGLPASAEAALTAHAKNGAEVSAILAGAPGVHYSRWVFSEEGKTVADLGNNGNALGYSPLGFTPRPVAPGPEGIPGKTIFVDQKNSQAADDGSGTKEKPFKSIQRALKMAEAGDCVQVLPGVYRESLRIPSGEPGKPVTVQGEEGTVVTGANPLIGWKKQGDKLWVIKGWTGRYLAPMDSGKDDARSYPDNLLFVDDEQMDWAPAAGDLVPGSWTFEPARGSGPKDIILYPLPGVSPIEVPVEISVRANLVEGAKYARIRGLHLTRSAGRAILTVGWGWVIEDNLIDWSAWGGIKVVGQDHLVRRNRILWCGNTGLDGHSGRLRFEDNTISYCAWRPFNPSWGGGAVKLIPGNMDHTMRHNTITCSNIAGIWYDAVNTGNLIEENVVYNCADDGGIFDEISFENTIRGNLVYNCDSAGINIGESNEDKVARNIVYNCSEEDILLRGANNGRKIDDPALIASRAKGQLDKMCIRRYQGMIDYRREQRLRDLTAKYWYGYDPIERAATRHNVLTENVLIDAGRSLISQSLDYAKPVDKDAENAFSRNIYWMTPADKVVRMRGASLGLATWQKLSGQDAESRMVDPFTSPEKMPDWFGARFPFKKGDVRPIVETKKYLDGAAKSIAVRVLLGRLLLSKRLEAAVFTDPKLHGVYFDLEGAGALALWREDMPSSGQWLVPPGKITVESRYQQRKPLNVTDGRALLYIGREPVTLIGVNGKVAEDDAVIIDVAPWHEPGKNVPVKLTLMNPEQKPRECALRVVPPEGWSAAKSDITLTLQPGQKNVMDLELAPPADLKRGSFQVAVSGLAGSLKVEKTKGFSFGSRNVIPQTDLYKKNCKGDLAGWGAVATGAPIGRADTLDQVVYLKKGEKWGGPSDLSAKVRSMWRKGNDLYLAIEVTDDKLDTHMRQKDPTQSDSVEIFLDIRAAWKQYMDEYGQGVGHFVVVPDGPIPTMKVLSPSNPLRIPGEIGCEPTETGYVLEMMIRFRDENLEEPWVAGRSLRIGVLVNDSDDPSSEAPKSRMGVWRTADNAPESCASWTAFVLGK